MPRAKQSFPVSQVHQSWHRSCKSVSCLQLYQSKRYTPPAASLHLTTIHTTNSAKHTLEIGQKCGIMQELMYVIHVQNEGPWLASLINTRYNTNKVRS